MKSKTRQIKSEKKKKKKKNDKLVKSKTRQIKSEKKKKKKKKKKTTSWWSLKQDRSNRKKKKKKKKTSGGLEISPSAGRTTGRCPGRGGGRRFLHIQQRLQQGSRLKTDLQEAAKNTKATADNWFSVKLLKDLRKKRQNQQPNPKNWSSFVNKKTNQTNKPTNKPKNQTNQTTSVPTCEIRATPAKVFSTAAQTDHMRSAETCAGLSPPHRRIARSVRRNLR